MISRLVGLRDDYVPTGFKPYGVKMHIFVSFLAYCLYVTLGQRLRALAPGLTARAVLEKMSALQMVDVRVPTTDGRLLILPRYTQPEKERKRYVKCRGYGLEGRGIPRAAHRAI